MQVQSKFLNDASFLKEIDNLQEKTISVKIIILNWDEVPIEEIQGKAISGNIQVSGSGNYRRSGSLTLLVDETNKDVAEINNIIALNKKCRIELGVVNTTRKYTQYPILWFPMGVFIFDSVTIDHSLDGVTMSVSLSDKMSLLNGEISGMIAARTEFASYDTVYIDRDGQYKQKVEQVPMSKIILEAVHHFGGESLSKIIIHDVPDTIKVAVHCERPPKKTSIDPEIKLSAVRYRDPHTYQLKYIVAESINKEEYIHYQDYEYVEDIFKSGLYLGFVDLPATFPSKNLELSANQPVTEVLKRIVEELGGNYEYFYDIHGNFVFQEIRNYLNTTKATYDLKFLADDLKNYTLDRTMGNTVYRFDNNNLVNSYTNSLQYNLIKNDIVVWGENKQTSQQLRYHLTIDKKPPLQKHEDIWFLQTQYDNSTIFYYPKKFIAVDTLPAIGKLGYYYFAADEQSTSQSGLFVKNNLYIYDDSFDNPWQPIIQPISKKDGEIVKPKIANPYISYIDLTFTNEQKTDAIYTWYGYDDTGLWIKDKTDKIPSINTQIVTQNPLPGETWNPDKVTSVFTIVLQISTIEAKDYRTELLLSGLEQEALFSVPNMYYAELKEEWPKLYNIKEGHFYSIYNDDPTLLTWYFDMIDEDANISKYSIANIGRRTIAEECNNKVNCVFEPSAKWDVFFIKGNENGTAPFDKEAKQLKIQYEQEGKGYAILPEQVYNYLDYDIWQDAYNQMRANLYVNTSYNDVVTLTTIPVYHLEPNSRIYIKDDMSGIAGDYMINSFDIPLDVNSTMTFSCTKCVQKI